MKKLCKASEMLRVAIKKAKQKRGRVKYRGLVADAAKLGVHRNHLYMVLSGRRKSLRLVKRYQELKEMQRAA